MRAPCISLCHRPDESKHRRARASTAIMLGLAISGCLVGQTHRRVSTVIGHLPVVGDRKTSFPPPADGGGGAIGDGVGCVGPKARPCERLGRRRSYGTNEYWHSIGDINFLSHPNLSHEDPLPLLGLQFASSPLEIV
jgi:hypothetical protein